MLAGPAGAYFFKYDKNNDIYEMIDVPGLLPDVYSDFWCIPSGERNDLMIFITLRKGMGNRHSTIEFRTFDTTTGVISKRLKNEDIDLPSRA